MKETKPGYKTTEFWLTLIVVLIGAAYGSGLVGDGSTIEKILGMASSVLGALGYTVVRGGVKKKAANGNS